MPATRTQIYLTERQREQLDRRARAEHKSLAELIRDAVDAYLERESPAAREAVLDTTFGAIPGLETPSRDEWDRDLG